MLRASHLTRRFGDRVAVDVSFDLPAGEVLDEVLPVRPFQRESILARWK